MMFDIILDAIISISNTRRRSGEKVSDTAKRNLERFLLVSAIVVAVFGAFILIDVLFLHW